MSFENNDLFFNDPTMGENPRNGDDAREEILSQRLQAPPLPGASDALVEENDNTAVLAELEDVPITTKKRKTINRGPKLDAKRLLSSRGIPAIPSYFENIKLKGKGHEAEDLTLVLSKLEHWAHRLYPKLTFDDCVEKLETLGHKKEVQTCMKKLRMGMDLLDNENQSTVISEDGPVNDKSDDEIDPIADNDHADLMEDIFPSVPAASLPSSPSGNAERPDVDDQEVTLNNPNDDVTSNNQIPSPQGSTPIPDDGS